MTGVDIGPFQNIVGVNWNDPLPSILIIRMIVREEFVPLEISDGVFYITTRFATDLPVPVIGEKGELGFCQSRRGSYTAWNRLNGRVVSINDIGKVVPGPPGSTAMWIDLREVRAAYDDYNATIAADTAGVAIPCPEFLDIEIGGFVGSSNFFTQTASPMTEIYAELVGGDNAVAFRADKGLYFADLGTINGRGRVIDGRFCTLYGVAMGGLNSSNSNNTRQDERGIKLASVRVSTQSVALTFNDEGTV